MDTLGDDPDDDSFFPAISRDGRYVTFDSEASNLVSGNGIFDVYLRRMR